MPGDSVRRRESDRRDRQERGVRDRGSGGGSRDRGDSRDRGRDRGADDGRRRGGHRHRDGLPPAGGSWRGHRGGDDRWRSDERSRPRPFGDQRAEDHGYKYRRGSREPGARHDAGERRRSASPLPGPPKPKSSVQAELLARIQAIKEEQRSSQPDPAEAAGKRPAWESPESGEISDEAQPATKKSRLASPPKGDRTGRTAAQLAMSELEQFKARAKAANAAAAEAAAAAPRKQGITGHAWALSDEEESDGDDDDANDAPAQGKAGGSEEGAEGDAGAAEGAAGAGGSAKEESDAGGDLFDEEDDVNIWQECRVVDEFERLNVVDEGTYGMVFRARDRRNGKIYALKKVKMEREREGFPMTSIREFQLLMGMRHDNVVSVREVVVGRDSMDSIYMVMEFMDHDLRTLMQDMPAPFQVSEVKCLVQQLLEGLAYLHSAWVIHRDLKPHNILYSNRGLLKICDFGMARTFGDPQGPMSPEVVTMWYRAPELFLGDRGYGAAVDVWSVGCIFAELVTGAPLFKSNGELDQIAKFCDVLGAPNEDVWPGVTQLPRYRDLSWGKQNKRNRLREKVQPESYEARTFFTDSGYDLLERLLTWDPKRRITAQDALQHPWFQEHPRPKRREEMPTFKSQKSRDMRHRNNASYYDDVKLKMMKAERAGREKQGLF
ncbi:unnamed protein product [Pedinophyceae sp. YPF-701]|nr:unnamed protein product [Pedinophyceae sp. YPF-701]